MKYTKENIQGLIVTYKDYKEKYIIDCHKKFAIRRDASRITWRTEDIITALKNGTFKEFKAKEKSYEIY